MKPADKIIGKFTDERAYEGKSPCEFQVIVSASDSPAGNYVQKFMGLTVKLPESTNMDEFIDTVRVADWDYAKSGEAWMRAERSYGSQIGSNVGANAYPATSNDPEEQKRLWNKGWKELESLGITPSDAAKSRIMELAETAKQHMGGRESAARS